MEKKIKVEKTARKIVTDVLYSKPGTEAYHAGNPFAVAFNEALNR